MAVVWILLASSGLFFARYTRDNWPDTKLLGTKVWFQVKYFCCTTRSGSDEYPFISRHSLYTVFMSSGKLTKSMNII